MVRRETWPLCAKVTGAGTERVYFVGSRRRRLPPPISLPWGGENEEAEILGVAPPPSSRQPSSCDTWAGHGIPPRVRRHGWPGNKAMYPSCPIGQMLCSNGGLHLLWLLGAAIMLRRYLQQRLHVPSLRIQPKR